MAKPGKDPKRYNDKNLAQSPGGVNPDQNKERNTFPMETSPNEKLSIPERKLKKEKK